MELKKLKKRLERNPDFAVNKGDRRKLIKQVLESSFRFYWEEQQQKRHLNGSFVLAKLKTATMEVTKNPFLIFTLINKDVLLRIRVEGFGENNDEKILITSADLYTKGLSGQVKGQGWFGYQSLEKLLYLLSRLSGYVIYNLAIPHSKSIHLLEQGGYQEISGKYFTTKIKSKVDKLSKAKLDYFFQMYNPQFPFYMKKYQLQKEKFNNHNKNIPREKVFQEEDLKNIVQSIERIAQKILKQTRA